MFESVDGEMAFYISIDWFKGQITGTSHISWENLWFPVSIFPSTTPSNIATDLHEASHSSHCSEVDTA